MRIIRDTQLLLGSSLLASLRNPVWVILGLFQPVVYLLLFAPLLEGFENAPGFGRGSALNTFTPGLLIMTAMYGAAFVGFGLIEDLRAGVIERLRVTPSSRLALLLGRVLRDVIVLLVQSALLMIVATLMGLRASLPGLILLFTLMALIGMMMASASYALALTVKDSDAFAASLNTIMLPLTLLSGILLPLALAPAIIRTLASFNPFAYAVDAARALMAGNLSSEAIPIGFAIVTAFALLALRWAVRTFRQATA